MLFGMLGSKHLYIADAERSRFLGLCRVILLLEANALFGKTGPMTSVKGVIHCSLGSDRRAVGTARLPVGRVQLSG